MALKVYTKEFAKVLEDVYEAQQHFMEPFGGALQVVDGIKSSDTFMSLKVSDVEVTIQDYDTGEDVGFGSGTGNSTRFGERKEIKSIDKDIEFEKPLAIHEGVDSVTVNDDADEVIKERAAAHAEAWVEHINGFLSEALSKNAGKTLKATELSKEGVIAAFDEASKEFTNNKVSKKVARYAYVSPDVYNLLVNNGLTTSAKNSSVNIDDNALTMFKGFVIKEIADEYFQTSENIYFVAQNVGVAGVGIEIYRMLDSEDFAGVAIQSAAKYGKYVPEKNKKAILKAKLKAPVASKSPDA